MNKHVKKYRKIVDDLIEESFPELRGKRIFVFEFLFLESRAFFTWPIVRMVFLGKRFRERSEIQVKAILSHELSHVLDFNYRNFFIFWVNAIRYFFSKEYKFKIENFADKEAIRRGYAKGLYSSRLLREKRVGDIEGSPYLTSKEIKKYAKEIGKWQQ